MHLPLLSVALPILTVLLSLSSVSARGAAPVNMKNYGDYHKAAQHAREAAYQAAQHAMNGQHGGSNNGGPTSTWKKQYPKPTNKAYDESNDLYFFFSTHDRNADNHLDGHELLRAFVDAEGDGSDMDGDGRIEEPKKHLTLDEVQNMVDHVLGEDDLDMDGMISWEEYLISHQQSD
ncbi:hypothetical protein HDV00_010114 [Rhizophlyctis rosea]|nr:hypothetical protein HDV00_010114 [Rhizophlyctis rosea]